MIKRLSFSCPGDCSVCDALKSGEIKNPIFCMTDQMFKSQLRTERMLNERLTSIEENIESIGVNLTNCNSNKIIAISEDENDALFPEDVPLDIKPYGKDK